MTVKRPLRVIARFDDLAVATLYHDAGRLEDRTLVLTNEIHRQPLPGGVNLEADVVEHVTLAFGEPGRACDRRGDIDRCDAVPSVQAAVGRKGDLEQIAHCRSSGVPSQCLASGVPANLSNIARDNTSTELRGR